jgi:hypothetical protein
MDVYAAAVSDLTEDGREELPGTRAARARVRCADGSGGQYGCGARGKGGQQPGAGRRRARRAGSGFLGQHPRGYLV